MVRRSSSPKSAKTVKPVIKEPAQPTIRDDIKARRKREIEQARQERQRAEDTQRDCNRLVSAGNLVASLGQDFELEQKADKDSLRQWGRAIAAYKSLLAERGMLERLEQAPVGLSVHDRGAWQTALDIFMAADKHLHRAVETLARLAIEDPDFAVSVAGWLRRGIRGVAEGHRLEPQILTPPAEKPDDGSAVNEGRSDDSTSTAGGTGQGTVKAAINRPTIYWLGDRTYRVGPSEPVVVSNNYDCILRAFLNRRVLDLPDLVSRSGLEREGFLTTLGRLKKVHKGIFAEAICCPGVKGSGYRADVVDARPDRSE